MTASKMYLILIFITILSIHGFCQDGHLIDKPDIPKYQSEITLLDSATYLFKAGDFYISGQPNDSILIALKKQDLKLIINIRTVEEIEKHVSSGKPAMLYFSSQPAALDSVDSEQYSQLKSFKESCQSRGLYESYDSHSGFRDKIYRQLQLKLNTLNFHRYHKHLD